MAANHMSDDEDDIWNYKSSVSKPKKKSSGQTRGSKSKNPVVHLSTPKMKDDALCEDKQKDVVIAIDSDEDFPTTNLQSKTINNEKSAVQWATMFLKTKDTGDKNIDIHKDKIVNPKNKRKSVCSRSPLKTKTNQPQKSHDFNLKNMKCKNQEVPSTSSSGIINYFSPTKTSPKKLKLSDAELSSSSGSNHDLLPLSNLRSNNEEILASIDELDCSSASSWSLSQEPKTNQSECVVSNGNFADEQGHLNETNLDRFDCELKPKVVDVIIVDDESDVSVAVNKTYSIDAISDSDISVMDSDLDTAGGFVRGDSEFYSSPQMSKSGPPHVKLDDKLTTTSSPNKLCPETKSDCDDTASDPPLPQSTAARKQVSILSFFPSKAQLSISKSNSDADQKYKGVIDSSIKRKAVPSLAKTSTYPSANTPSGGGRDAPTTSTLSESYKNKQYTGRQRQCPFYKRIPGTSITVDAFRYGDIPGCNAYFLTHFHYDHYGGLTKKFSQPIYCSVVTGNLVERRLGVDKRWIRRLPMWKSVTVEDVTLTLMEANHCPGAVIVLFETKNGKKILHTGDFRASLEMEDYPSLKNIAIDELYLDTTYCNPSYAFPSQKTVIDFAVSLVEKQMTVNSKTLIVCGSYTIGKERIFTAIAKAINSKICVMSDKKKVLDCLDDEDLKKRVTLNWSEGQVHVLPMAKLKQEPLFDHHTRHSSYTSILAFEPTGWTHSNKSLNLDSLQPKWSKNGVTLYGIPYSEHSSYLELKRFVQFIRPKKILPTVNNGNAVARKKMEGIFEEWLSE